MLFIGTYLFVCFLANLASLAQGGVEVKENAYDQPKSVFTKDHLGIGATGGAINPVFLKGGATETDSGYEDMDAMKAAAQRTSAVDGYQDMSVAKAAVQRGTEFQYEDMEAVKAAAQKQYAIDNDYSELPDNYNPYDIPPAPKHTRYDYPPTKADFAQGPAPPLPKRTHSRDANNREKQYDAPKNTDRQISFDDPEYNRSPITKEAMNNGFLSTLMENPYDEVKAPRQSQDTEKS